MTMAIEFKDVQVEGDPCVMRLPIRFDDPKVCAEDVQREAERIMRKYVNVPVSVEAMAGLRADLNALFNDLRARGVRAHITDLVVKTWGERTVIETKHGVRVIP
jgi:hypothetical protein